MARMTADAAALLVTVRREAGLTQAELARRAKTSQAIVARYVAPMEQLTDAVANLIAADAGSPGDQSS